MKLTKTIVNCASLRNWTFVGAKSLLTSALCALFALVVGSARADQADDKKITWNVSDNHAFKFDTSESKWFMGKVIDTATAPEWTASKADNPSRNGSNGFVLYFDTSADLGEKSKGNTSDGGGIWVTGNSIVKVSAGEWVGSFYADEGSILNASTLGSSKLKDCKVVALGVVNITTTASSAISFEKMDGDQSEERLWYVGKNGKITVDNLNIASGKSIKVYGDIDDAAVGIPEGANGRTLGYRLKTKELILFGNLNSDGVERISTGTIYAGNGTAMTKCTGEDEFVASSDNVGKYTESITTSGVSITYVIQGPQVETLIWAGTSSDYNWVDQGTSWKKGDNAATFLNGDNVVFNSSADKKDITLGGNVVVGTMTVDANSGNYTTTGNYTVTGDELTVNGNFQVGTAQGNKVNFQFNNITVNSGAKLTYNNSHTTWQKLTLNGGNFSIFDLNDGGMSINELNIATASKMEGTWADSSLDLPVNVKVLKGSGNLTMSQSSEPYTFTVGDMSDYTGALSIGSKIRADLTIGEGVSKSVALTGEECGIIKRGDGTLTVSGFNKNKLQKIEFAGGTMVVGESAIDNAAKTLKNGGAVNVSAHTTLNATDKFALIGVDYNQIAMKFSNNATLTKTGSGTVYIVNANLTGSGTLAVNEGTIELGGNSDTGNSATAFGNDNHSVGLNIGANGTFKLANAASATMASLSGAGTLDLGGKTFTVNNANGTTVTFTGTIRGVGASFVKNGAGTQVLSGANTYTGGTTIGAGTLKVSNATAISSGDVTINSGATLDICYANSDAAQIKLTAGTFTLNEGGKIAINGDEIELAESIGTGTGTWVLSTINGEQYLVCNTPVASYGDNNYYTVQGAIDAAKVAGGSCTEVKLLKPDVMLPDGYAMVSTVEGDTTTYTLRTPGDIYWKGLGNFDDNMVFYATSAKDGATTKYLAGDTIIFDADALIYPMQSLTKAISIRVMENVTLNIGHDGANNSNPYNIPDNSDIDIKDGAHVCFRFWDSGQQGYARVGTLTVNATGTNGTGYFTYDSSLTTRFEMGNVSGTATLVVPLKGTVIASSVSNPVTLAGTLKVATEKSSGITKSDDIYEIARSTEGAGDNLRYVYAAKYYVAAIDTKRYGTLAAALEDANDGTTIVLLSDVTDSEVTINKGTEANPLVIQSDGNYLANVAITIASDKVFKFENTTTSTGQNRKLLVSGNTDGTSTFIIGGTAEDWGLLEGTAIRYVKAKIAVKHLWVESRTTAEFDNTVDFRVIEDGSIVLPQAYTFGNFSIDGGAISDKKTPNITVNMTADSIINGTLNNGTLTVNGAGKTMRIYAANANSLVTINSGTVEMLGEATLSTVTLSDGTLKVASGVIAPTMNCADDKYIQKTMDGTTAVYNAVEYPTGPITPPTNGGEVIIPTMPETGVTVEPGVKLTVPAATDVSKITVKYGETVLSGGENAKVTVTINDGVVTLAPTDAAKPTIGAMSMPKEGEEDKICFAVSAPVPGLFYGIISADTIEALNAAMPAEEDGWEQATSSDSKELKIKMPTNKTVQFFKVRVSASKNP